MFRYLVAALFILTGTALAPAPANAIMVTLDNASLTIERPLAGTAQADFTGTIVLTPGYDFFSTSATSLWTASGDLIGSVFPSPTFQLTGTLFSVTVSATDALGLYAFDHTLTSPAEIAFAECPTLGGACNNAVVSYSVNVVAPAVTRVPEPATLTLFGLGFVALIRRARRQPRTGG